MALNVFQFSALVEKNWEMNLADMSGYKRKYTFYSDFAIAEFCEVKMGEKNAIKKTFNEVIASWGKSIEAMTEIVMVLNHKSWAYYQKVDSSYMSCSDGWARKFAELYSELYYKVDEFVRQNFNDGDLAYYYSVTD